MNVQQNCRAFIDLWMSILFSVKWLEWNTSFYMLKSPFFLSFGSNSGSPLPKVKMGKLQALFS